MTRPLCETIDLKYTNILYISGETFSTHRGLWCGPQPTGQIVCCHLVVSHILLFPGKGLVTNYGEGGYKTGGWGESEVLPLQKKGGGRKKF